MQSNNRIYRTSNILKTLFQVEKPIIPTLHLLSLPGSPFYCKQSIHELIDYTVQEMEILLDCGVEGFIIENHGDIPFVKPEEFPYETVSIMSRIGAVVRDIAKSKGKVIGVNCLANAAIPALAIAKAIDADFIRVNQYVNAYIANEGFVEGLAGKILRYRTRINAENIAIFSDVHVKHGSHAIVADRPILEQALDAVFFCSDALICTGFRTGDVPSNEEIESLRVDQNIPIIIGSGVSPENLERVLMRADAAIVASYFKKDGIWSNTVDRERCMRFMEKVRNLREKLNP